MRNRRRQPQMISAVSARARRISSSGASIIVSGGRIGYQIELAPEELIRLARADTADIICG